MGDAAPRAFGASGHGGPRKTPDFFMARPKKEDAIDIKGRAISESLALLRGTPGSLSLSVLARRIGCSAPALYAHFRSKGDLLEQARMQAVHDLSADGRILIATDTEAPGTPPMQRIRDGGRRILGLARESPAIYRLIFAPDHDTGGSGIDLFDIAIRPIARNLDAALPDRAAAAPASDALARTVWFTLHGAATMAMDRQLGGPQERRWDRAAEALDDVLDLLDSRAAAGAHEHPRFGGAMSRV